MYEACLARALVRAELVAGSPPLNVCGCGVAGIGLHGLISVPPWLLLARRRGWSLTTAFCASNKGQREGWNGGVTHACMHTVLRTSSPFPAAEHVVYVCPLDSADGFFLVSHSLTHFVTHPSEVRRNSAGPTLARSFAFSSSLCVRSLHAAPHHK